MGVAGHLQMIGVRYFALQKKRRILWVKIDFSKAMNMFTYTGPQGVVECKGQHQANDRGANEESDYQPAVGEVCQGAIAGIIEYCHEHWQA